MKAFFKKIGGFFKNLFRRQEAEGILTREEEKRITMENRAAMKAFEKEKQRDLDPSEYTTRMRDGKNIVEFDNLHTCFFTDTGVLKAVDGVTLEIPKGATVGIVGESGCGKSITAMSLMRLIQGPQGQITEGEIRFFFKDYVLGEDGKPVKIWVKEPDREGNLVTKQEEALDKKGRPLTDKEGQPVLRPVQARDENGLLLFETEDKVYNLAKTPAGEMYKIRGAQAAMIFQEPMTSLNPVMTVGAQLDEVTLLHIFDSTPSYAKERSIDILRQVGIAMPETIYKRFPHELSGGMRQRVMIAMAIACNPRLIIADEPTTALDVTIQAQILDLLREIKRKFDGSLMLITHDLGVIAEMADYVYVMYAGRIVEAGTVREIFHSPCHPYTAGLQKSKPDIEHDESARLHSIPGRVPNPIELPDHCYFYDRCDKRTEGCHGSYPETVNISDTHTVACHLMKAKEKEKVKEGKRA